MMIADLQSPALIDTRFGAFAASAGDVIHLVGGLPGFESCTRYVLLKAQELHPFKCLQGLDGSKPSFLVIDPALVEPTYRAGLDGVDLRRLDAEIQDALAWFAIVCVGPDEVATVNLRAPVVINPRRMVGIQVVPNDSSYGHEHPLCLEPHRAGVHS